ncbi:MAG: hypothetical protein NTW86_27350 [Candidatus Sumerlaeota bacterium]|nr:hypothetical protein [Candidatus Sumerlaeota bacterium]
MSNTEDRSPKSFDGGRALPLGGAAAFCVAFVFSAWRACVLHSAPPTVVPDLAAAIQLKRLSTPIALCLVHEGEWEWARGGRFYVATDGVQGLAAKTLTPTAATAERANAAGAEPPWRAGAEASGGRSRYELAAAAAWIGDWWRLQLRHALRPCLNRFAGHWEPGLSPSALAALYEQSAQERPEAFPLSGADRRDPATGRPVPCSLSAMARLFARAAEARATSDTLVPARPAGWPGVEAIRFEDFAMDGPPAEILASRLIRSDAEADGASARLIHALRGHGVLLVGRAEDAWTANDGDGQTVFVERAGVLIGYYERDGRRLFLLRSPTLLPASGDHTETPLELVSIDAIAGAWAFPHPFRAQCQRERDGTIRLGVTDGEGKPLRLHLPEDLELGFAGCLWRAPGGQLRIAPQADQAGDELRIAVHPRGFLPLEEPKPLVVAPIQ